MPPAKKTTPRKTTTKKQEFEVPKDVNGISAMIEKVGLSTFLLLGAAYFAWNGVVLPVVQTVQTAITDISETNKVLEQAVEDNQKADAERVKVISSEIEKLNRKLDEILEAVDAERTRI